VAPGLEWHLVYIVCVLCLLAATRVGVAYMFRALVAHPQGALHKPDLAYCVRVMSVGRRINLVYGTNLLIGRRT
jgi:hypothetical protein